MSTYPSSIHSVNAVQKFLPDDTEETAAGHLHRLRQGIRSTRRNNSPEDLEPELEGQGAINKDRTE